MDFRIFPPDGLVEGTVALPLSKSIANRALVIAALTPGMDLPCFEDGECDDIAMMRHALSSRSRQINVGAAGTAMRFATAVLSATIDGYEVVLDGNERMRQRPIAPLVDALRQCGAGITYLGADGFPPLSIEGHRLHGGEVSMPADVSSQFVSALLMVAPTMERGLRLTLTGEPVSAPYVDMTLAMMRRAGIDARRVASNIIEVPHGLYKCVSQSAEPDWSAAAFIYEIEALSSGAVCVSPQLAADSLQGDHRVSEIFAALGVDTIFEGERPGSSDLVATPELTPRLQLDMADIPDLVQPLVVTCCMLRLPFRLYGVRNLRIKETDRLQALVDELDRLGFMLTIEGDNLISWEGAQHPIDRMPEFETHGDHRMAMALAPVALYLPGIVVKDADVVCKSWPGYWDALASLGFRMVDASLPVASEEEAPA